MWSQKHGGLMILLLTKVFRLSISPEDMAQLISDNPCPAKLILMYKSDSHWPTKSSSW